MEQFSSISEHEPKPGIIHLIELTLEKKGIDRLIARLVDSKPDGTRGELDFSARIIWRVDQRTDNVAVCVAIMTSFLGFQINRRLGALFKRLALGDVA